MRKRISKYKHLHSNRFRYWCSSIPLVCASGLLVTLGLMVNPVGTSNKTFAALVGTATNPDDNTTSPAISIGVGNTDLRQSATASAAAYVSTGVTISANNLANYSVYVQDSGSANDKLVGATMGGLIDQTTSATIGTNQWGYALKEGDTSYDPTTLDYKAVSASGNNSSPAYSTTENGNKSFTLAFGVRFGADAKADHYRANVVVSVAANPGIVTDLGLGFDGEIEMQKLTPSKCSTVTEGTEGLMKDARDGKTYWVAKMKDGNCWMTQNLDYDGGGVQITQIAKWNSTQLVTNDTAAYYDPGAYFYRKVVPDSECNGSTIGIPKCLDSGWEAIPDFDKDSTWTITYDQSFVRDTTYIGTDGQTVCHKLSGHPFGDDSGSTSVCRIYYFDYSNALNQLMDADYRHYLIGNYYSWSSTAYNGTQAYFLYFSSSAVNPSSNTSRYIGMSVRCLVQGS